MAEITKGTGNLKMLDNIRTRMVVAYDRDRTIGRDNEIPWTVPRLDKWRFRSATLDFPVLMGRKTFNSLSCPLAHRKNIVLTKNLDKYDNLISKYFNRNWVYPCSSLFDVVDLLNNLGEDKVAIIGGGQIYEMFLPYTDEIFITEFSFSIGKDSKNIKFPELGNNWKYRNCVSVDKFTCSKFGSGNNGTMKYSINFIDAVNSDFNTVP